MDKSYYIIVRSWLLFVTLCLFASTASAQCSINAPDDACVDDLVSLSAQSSNGVKSVLWEFGDNNTSSTLSPNHRYASSGTFTIKATITQSNNVTCVVTRQIEVFNKPNVDIQLSSSSVFCLTSNKVCIIDNSTSGNSGSSNTKRTILWGDGGKTDKLNPRKGDETCYTYSDSGQYRITVEITNDKGCEAIKEIDAEVKYDLIGKFSTGRIQKTCTSQTNYFILDSSWFKHTDNMSDVYLDYGDGQIDKITSFNTDEIYHTYDSAGNYMSKLIFKFKNGCTTTWEKAIGITLDKVDLNIEKSDSALCYPFTFSFSHRLISGAIYSWAAFDAYDSLIDLFSGSRAGYFWPRSPGMYRIQLKVKRGDCISEQNDTVHSIGVLASALLLNASQCEAKDTVYFCDNSITYGVNNPLEYLWNFMDENAPQCTTSKATGHAVDSNCNFSTDSHTKHFYDSSFCDQILLSVKDPVTGCKDSSRHGVVLKEPDPKDFEAEYERPCLRAPVRFKSSSCYSEIRINYDSAADRSKFEEFLTPYLYQSTADSNGWVTFGVAVKTGSNKVYRSCDLTDFYIDESRECYDTFWYTRAIHLNPRPRPQALIRFDGCLPTTLNGSFYVKDQPNVEYIVWTWGDGDIDSVVADDSTLYRPFQHTYTKSGQYDGSIEMTTDSNCTSLVFFERDIGFYNNFTFKQPICPGSTVQLIDTVAYWGDTTQYWRWEPPDFPSTPETIKWDFGDGNGFSTTGALATTSFDSIGTYTVKMVAIDKTGCSDTTVKEIKVEGILAGIKDLNKKIVCDDILQVFDSSFVPDPDVDSIVNHYWDFGDNKTPSKLQDPYHFYSSFGDFTITHVVENTVGCKDTAQLTLTIKGPVPDFDILTDTVGCAPHSVTFTNNSRDATDYIWYFGDSTSTSNTLSTDADTSVTFTYQNPGTYYIYLFAGDSVVNEDNNSNIYYCNALFPDTTSKPHPIRRVVVLPIPEVDFASEGPYCVGKAIALQDLSDTIYDTYRWYINTDSVITTNASTSYVPKDTGTINITYLPIYTPEGPYQRACYDTSTKQLVVYEHKIGLSVVKDSLCPIYTFVGDLADSDSFYWDFGHPESGDKNISTDVETTHAYMPTLGTFDACLFSVDIHGCRDTACTEVDNDYIFELMTPNIITLNSDGLNDEFDITMEGESLYELSIFNRWGERMFYSNVDAEYQTGLNWDGTTPEGRPCPAGTYFYVLKYLPACTENDKVRKTSGTITIIRD